MVACHAALDDPGHLRDSVELVRRERTALATGLTGLGFRVWGSHGNFLLFRPLLRESDKNLAKTTKEIADHLERDHEVRIRNLGGGFGMPGHLRVTVGRPQDNIRFLESLKLVLRDLELPSVT